MKNEVGTEYQISEDVKRNFNSADTMTIIRQVGDIVQFKLNECKGHGSMPLPHLQYLLKKNYLNEWINKRQFIMKGDEEEQIV